MINTFQKFIKFVMLVLFILGLGLVIKSKIDVDQKPDQPEFSTKTMVLKNYLGQQKKPQRIEIFGLSERFARQIGEIKKLKVAQDKNSDFYVTIQLFSDEKDESAPLIAQIRLIDIKSGNLIKEESINLE